MVQIGDLVRCSLLEEQYGIIVDIRTRTEPINGIMAQQTLYSVSWTSGILLHGFRQWELEAVYESR